MLCLARMPPAREHNALYFYFSVNAGLILGEDLNQGGVSQDWRRP